MSPAADRPDLPTNTSKASASSTGGKRKREPATHIPADILNDKLQEEKGSAQLHQLLKDSLEILKRHDVTPSILHHPIPSPSTDAPATKRVKLSTAIEERTISRRVEANAYNCVNDFSKDLDAVVASVIEKLESTALNGEFNDSHKIRHERHPDVVRAIAFKRKFNNIILRELIQRPHLMSLVGSENNQSPAEEAISGKEELPPGIAYAEDETNYSNVLTLFGGSGSGSGQPKQLFSSLKDTQVGPNHGVKDPKTTYSEAGLPNGITFTKIVPVHSQGDEGKKEVPTIGKLFAPPPNIQPLNPPRQSRHTATRSSSVNWYNPAEITTPSRPNRRDSYGTQPLTTGQWLTYNVIPSTKDLASPETKRKQRDRALSFGEPQTELSEKTLTLHRQAKDDALFRSVYSGFAPDQDNAGALVPQQSKNRIWWKRVGEQRFHNSKLGFQQAPSYASVDPPSTEDNETLVDEQGISLEEAVRTWEPDTAPADFTAGQREEGDDANAKGMEEMLNDISELLETLNSYQDVRNLSLANNVRTTTGQNAQLSAMTGTPASPSPEEMEIYTMLKSQLSIMISSLPPYALSKLDGRKLGKLNINTKIQVDTKSFQGSLEEDEISTRGRQPSATNFPSRTPSAAGGLAPRNNYPMASSTPAALSHRASHLPPTVPARATAPSSYLSNQQYSTRPPSANQYFANNARPSYTGQRPITSSTPDRYPYTGSQQYSQSAGRQPYANGYNQYSNANGTPYGQGYAHSPQVSTGNRTSQPPYPPSSRPTQSYGYTATPTPAGGSTSPSKAAAQYASQGYAGPSSTPSQARAPAYHQHSSQYNHAGAASPLVNGTSMGGASSPQAQQSSADQAAEMQRQKAQSQETQGRGSSTPQTAHATPTESNNGTSKVQANGGSTVQNG
ncbi:MAG: hypothetical protein L6R38_004981 [Xanthoria sp. 2 TBL-2021]|nr:MAG: hypothetical protein L6R38_004981 [Xanthoria sp. 2 TBL-2021]